MAKTLRELVEEAAAAERVMWSMPNDNCPEEIQASQMADQALAQRLGREWCDVDGPAILAAIDAERAAVLKEVRAWMGHHVHPSVEALFDARFPVTREEGQG